MNNSIPSYCKFSFISLNKNILESEAWNSLSIKQIRVFVYLWSCLVWYKDKKKKKTYSDAILTARLTRILRDGEYDHTTGNVKLWEPTL